ncbi:MAG: beta-ketoacyl-ACP synthase III [Pseudomonadota bacterium]
MRLKHQPAGTTLTGFGHAAPERVVTNAELETSLGLEPGWIETRTGIRERRWVDKGQAVSDIGLKAGDMALQDAAARGIAKTDVALTLLATSTPDHLLPPTAPLIAHQLGLSNSGAVDLTGACAGYLYALGLADGFVRQHRKSVLIIAANVLSQRINRQERASVVLFSDAAGATVLSPTTTTESGIVGVDYASDGSCYEDIQIPGGGSRQPFAPELDPALTKMRLQNGPSVFQKAVQMMGTTGKAALADAGWQPSDIDHWVPHQANARIIEAARRALSFTPAQTRSSVQTYGNSSAASIPFTLSQLHASRPLTSGAQLLFSAAGAGLTGGSIALRL